MAPLDLMRWMYQQQEKAGHEAAISLVWLANGNPKEADKLLKKAFNMVQMPLIWRQIEASEGAADFSESDAIVDWAQAESLPIYGGPLLSFDDLMLPDWQEYLTNAEFPLTLEADDSIGFYRVLGP